METKTAIIKSATITCGDLGFLDCWIDLDYGGTGQLFGGYVLYLPKSFAHHEVNSPAGHFIFRVMEVAGVTRWDDLKGKTVRVKADHCRVEAIGHIVNDDWFTPAEDMRKAGHNAPVSGAVSASAPSGCSRLSERVPGYADDGTDLRDFGDQ